MGVTYAYLFLWGEIIDNVEKFANFFRSLSLDHVGHGLTANVAGGCKVVRREQETKQKRTEAV